MFHNCQFSEAEMINIYKLFYKRVFHEAYFVTKDLHLAQDILQETFIKAFIQLDSLQDEDKMGRWLSTIATRTAIDYLRKENKNRREEYDEALTKSTEIELIITVEDIVEDNLIVEEIANKIMELKKEYREILILKYIHELKQKEIAELTDLNVGTVKSRLHRATEALKLKLIKDKAIVSDALRKGTFLVTFFNNAIN